MIKSVCHFFEHRDAERTQRLAQGMGFRCRVQISSSDRSESSVSISSLMAELPEHPRLLEIVAENVELQESLLRCESCQGARLEIHRSDTSILTRLLSLLVGGEKHADSPLISCRICGNETMIDSCRIPTFSEDTSPSTQNKYR